MENHLHEISEPLKAQFLRLYSMALSDDQFHPKELKYLYDLATSRGVSENSLNDILLHPSDINNRLPETLKDKVTYLYELAQIIWADGTVDEKEINALDHYIVLFGFTEDSVKELREYILNAVKNNKSLDQILEEL